jgi:hypothetical protein
MRALSSWLRKRDKLKSSTSFSNLGFGDREEFLVLLEEQKLLELDRPENGHCLAVRKGVVRKGGGSDI